MYGKLKKHLQLELQDIKNNGLYKEERIITSAQGAEITLNTGETVLNFCKYAVVNGSHTVMGEILGGKVKPIIGISNLENRLT